MAPLTGAQISIDRWSKLLLIGCVLLILVSGHAFFGCGRHGGPREDQHHSAPAQQQQQPDSAVVSIAINGNNGHASASFTFSDPNQQAAQEEQESFIAAGGNNNQQMMHPHSQPQDHGGFSGKKGRCCCALRGLAGLGLATGATGVIAAFRPSRCGVALFLIGILVVEVLTLLRVTRDVMRNLDQCMAAASTVDEITTCGDFGRRAAFTAPLIVGVLTVAFATCGARLGRGVVARELEERVEAEADALRDAIVAGAVVPIVVGSCDLAPLPAYVLAVEGTACVEEGGACSV